MSDINEIMEKIKKNSPSENKALAESLKESLDDDKKAALYKLLEDKTAMKKLLESEAARELMKKLGGE